MALLTAAALVGDELNALAGDFKAPRSMVLEALRHLHREEALPIILPLAKPKKPWKDAQRNCGCLKSTHASLTPRGPGEGARVQMLEPMSPRGCGSTRRRR